MTRRKKTEPASAGFACYVGPTILGVIQQNKIMPGTVEEFRDFYASAIERFPAIRHLIVDGNDLADARNQINTPGNLLYVKYRQVLRK